jgi:hypothetical protein
LPHGQNQFKVKRHWLVDILSDKEVAVGIQESPVTHIEHGIDAKKPLDIAAELRQSGRA